MSISWKHFRKWVHLTHCFRQNMLIFHFNGSGTYNTLNLNHTFIPKLYVFIVFLHERNALHSVGFLLFKKMTLNRMIENRMNVNDISQTNLLMKYNVWMTFFYAVACIMIFVLFEINRSLIHCLKMLPRPLEGSGQLLCYTHHKHMLVAHILSMIYICN